MAKLSFRTKVETVGELTHFVITHAEQLQNKTLPEIREAFVTATDHKEKFSREVLERVLTRAKVQWSLKKPPQKRTEDRVRVLARHVLEIAERIEKALKSLDLIDVELLPADDRASLRALVYGMSHKRLPLFDKPAAANGHANGHAASN